MRSIKLWKWETGRHAKVRTFICQKITKELFKIKKLSFHTLLSTIFLEEQKKGKK